MFTSLPKKVCDMNEKQLLQFVLCNQIYMMQKFNRVFEYLKSGKHDPNDLTPFMQKEEILAELMDHTWDAVSAIHTHDDRIAKEIKEAESE